MSTIVEVIEEKVLQSLVSSQKVEPCLDGVRFEINFFNGFGASVVKHSGSYGVELAVIDSTGSLRYDTPITNDVIGWLDIITLRETLLAIAALPEEN